MSRADKVFMAKLSSKWKGQAQITKCLGPVNCTVSLVDNPTNVDTCHVQNLKPCHGFAKSSSESGDV